MSKEEMETLRREKEALLRSLPDPGPLSSSRSVTYQSIRKKASDGSEIVLEWRDSSGWSIRIEE